MFYSLFPLREYLDTVASNAVSLDTCQHGLCHAAHLISLSKIIYVKELFLAL